MRLVPAVLALVVLVGLASAAVGTPVAAAEPNSAPGAAPSLAAAAGGATTPAVDAAAAQTANATLSGTVSYANGSAAGDAVVLVGQRAFFEKASPGELREVAAGSPQDVAVAETDDAGSYSLTVGESVDAEAVVAVSSAGISRVQSFEPGELDLTIRDTRTLRLEVVNASTEPGGRTTVEFHLRNTGDVAVENLKVRVGSLPEGWNVVSTESEAGTYSTANQTFVWDAVEPGESASATLRLFVAIDADRTTHELPVVATSATHDIDANNASVTVAYPDEGPTETAVGGADADGDAGVSTPGFGPVVALAALVVAAVLLARRG